MFEIPHYVTELYAKKEDLRTLRENVLLVVRDYNRYADSMVCASQTVLCKESWKELDTIAFKPKCKKGCIQNVVVTLHISGV